jgi:membrane protease YdiL (CAAX protease family)
VVSLSWANRILFGIVLLVQLFFLVSGSALFPAYWAKYQWGVWMPIYFAITLAAAGGSMFLGSGKGYGASPFGDPFGMFPMVEALFMVGFFASLFLFQLPILNVPLAIPSADATSTVLMNFAVISFGEELMFRWFLIGLLSFALRGKLIWAAVPISSAVWAGFHLAAYGESPNTLLFIFVLGIPFGALFLLSRRMGGIGASWGAHFGWNLGVAGLFSLGLH